MIVGADSITDMFNTLCNILTMSLFCVKSHGKQILCVCVCAHTCIHACVRAHFTSFIQHGVGGLD